MKITFPDRIDLDETSRKKFEALPRLGEELLVNIESCAQGRPVNVVDG